MVEETIKELMVSLILVAYEDYRALQRHGIIVRGKVIPGQRVRLKYMRITDASSAVWFFWQGGLEIAVEVGGLKTDLNAVKQKLEPEVWREL